MNSTEAQGIGREIAGGVQETAGAMADDRAMELTGMVKTLRGDSQQLVADAAVVAREAITENPLRVLGITAALGFALGALWCSSRH